MHPVLLGPVKSYGFLLALSFLLGMALSLRRARQRGVDPATVYDLVFLVLVTSLVGVRLAYVLTHLRDFTSLPQVFAIWDGGLTLYGGILLATFAVWWFCRRHRLAFLKIADLLAPGVILGIGITRIGCFLAGCCYGKPCDLPWAVHFPPGSDAVRKLGEHGLHPSQLYGSAAGFLIFGLLLLCERRPAPPGATFARFLAFYGVARFCEDFTRYYETDQRLMLGWTNNQWLSLALVAGGLALLLWGRRRGAPAA
jgi:phosphatidylglycerol---prolipoprotein diacylglyceryl transferase